MSDCFECPRHAGHLRLTPDACARLHRRGQRAERWQLVWICRDCPTGAQHAGLPTPEPLPEPPACAWCGRHTRRRVFALLCVGCYNRLREIALGRNRRGTAPTRLLARLGIYRVDPGADR